jgi:AcrR family transcriptional regulator
MRRAHRPEQKEARRQTILAAALQLFREVPYAELRMADLATRLGLGKGTLYLYFPTKEALFLSVLQAEMGAWFQGAADLLERGPRGASAGAVAEGLVEELLARPLLPKLQALLHGVLEQNVPRAEAVAFAKFLQAGVLKVGRRLEAVLPGLPPGQGSAYLIRFHALVMGTQLMSSRPPVVQEALQEPDMTMFDFTFRGVLGSTAVDLLKGMLRPSADPFQVGGEGLRLAGRGDLEADGHPVRAGGPVGQAEPGPGLGVAEERHAVSQ